MAIFELNLTGFTFPKDLDEARSTFRFLFSVRYIDSGDKFATAQAVLPGLDSYWECEKAHKADTNFVRKVPETNPPSFDMKKIDAWDSLVVMLTAKRIHSIQVKVIDIEKEGGLLDKIKDYAGTLLNNLLGAAKTAATGAVPGAISFAKEALGDAVSDVEALALAKLAGMKGEEKLLFKLSVLEEDLPAAPGGAFNLEGEGFKGAYSVSLNLKTT
jgi:hypothetical protein